MYMKPLINIAVSGIEHIIKAPDLSRKVFLNNSDALSLLGYQYFARHRSPFQAVSSLSSAKALSASRDPCFSGLRYIWQE
jgi:hypothetical protein